MQSRCVQGSYLWPPTPNCPNLEEALDRTQRPRQEALDIRKWKGDRAAETYVARCPKAQTATLRRATGRSFFYGLAQHALGKKAGRVLRSCAQGPPSNPTEGFPSPEPVHAHLSCSEIRDMAELCGPIADVAINEDGLPTPTDTLASQVVGWRKHGSLSICTQCHSAQARRLEPSNLRRTTQHG